MMSKKWYVVHAYSGFEKSVQRTLLDRISRAGMQDQFGQILVPVEEVVEMKSGQKNISERKFFPGYVLVEMEMTDDTLAPGEEHAEGDRLRRRHGDQADADLAKRKCRTSCTRSRKAWRSRGPRFCSKWARRCA